MLSILISLIWCYTGALSVQMAGDRLPKLAVQCLFTINFHSCKRFFTAKLFSAVLSTHVVPLCPNSFERFETHRTHSSWGLFKIPSFGSKARLCTLVFTWGFYFQTDCYLCSALWASLSAADESMKRFFKVNHRLYTSSSSHTKQMQLWHKHSERGKWPAKIFITKYEKDGTDTKV